MQDAPHNRDKARLYAGKSRPRGTRIKCRFGWVLSRLKLVSFELSQPFKTNALMLIWNRPRTPAVWLGTVHLVQLR